MAEEKVFKTYEEQVDLLVQRGMLVADRDAAVRRLRQINYYRLSGYWYPFRKRVGKASRSDQFFDGTTFDDVVALHDFDVRLRAAVLSAVSAIELQFRAQLGHELGRVNPLAHLDPKLLGPVARSDPTRYKTWIKRYEDSVSRSREEFVRHHRKVYGGRIPIWAAVEVLDWGQLVQLYAMAPDLVRRPLSDDVGLSSAQLESWMTCLNILRNIAAHQGRMFNRVYPFKPKMPRGPDPVEIKGLKTRRLFGQLSLVQYLLRKHEAGDPNLLPRVLRTYPSVRIVPLSHTGASEDWQTLTLWRI